jgi:hypothetical protein
MNSNHKGLIILFIIGMSMGSGSAEASKLALHKLDVFNQILNEPKISNMEKRTVLLPLLDTAEKLADTLPAHKQVAAHAFIQWNRQHIQNFRFKQVQENMKELNRVLSK